MKVNIINLSVIYCVQLWLIWIRQICYLLLILFRITHFFEYFLFKRIELFITTIIFYIIFISLIVLWWIFARNKKINIFKLFTIMAKVILFSISLYTMLILCELSNIWMRSQLLNLILICWDAFNWACRSLAN